MNVHVIQINHSKAQKNKAFSKITIFKSDWTIQSKQRRCYWEAQSTEAQASNFVDSRKVQQALYTIIATKETAKSYFMQDKKNSSYDEFVVDVSKPAMSSYIIHNLKGATRLQSKRI